MIPYNNSSNEEKYHHTLLMLLSASSLCYHINYISEIFAVWQMVSGKIFSDVNRFRIVSIVFNCGSKMQISEFLQLQVEALFSLS